MFMHWRRPATRLRIFHGSLAGLREYVAKSRALFRGEFIVPTGETYQALGAELGIAVEYAAPKVMRRRQEHTSRFRPIRTSDWSWGAAR